MKNPLVTFLLILLASWYAFGVFMGRAYGATWTASLLWPVTKIKNRFTTQPAIGSETFATRIPAGTDLEASSMT